MAGAGAISPQPALKLKTRPARSKTGRCRRRRRARRCFTRVRTHGTAPNAIHRANGPEDSKRILADVDKAYLAARTRADDVLAANPRDPHWRAYIAACYDEVRKGKIDPGITPEFALGVIAEVEATMAKGETQAGRAREVAVGDINETLLFSIDHAFTIDQAKVRDALSFSKVDGDPAKHDQVLRDLRTLFNGSVWMTVLAQPLTKAKS